MTAEKTMIIAANGTIILDKAVIGTEGDITLTHGEEYEVPVSYGEHLVGDRFATAVDKKRRSKSSMLDEKERKAVAEAAALERRKAAARDAVAAAQNDIAAAGDDMLVKAKAEAALDAAEKDLAAIEAA